MFVYGTVDAVVTDFRVYDINGIELYSQDNTFTNSELNEWDGSYKGVEMPAWVYIRTVLAEFPDGRKDSLTGTTTLLR